MLIRNQFNYSYSTIPKFKAMTEADLERLKQEQKAMAERERQASQPSAKELKAEQDRLKIEEAIKYT